MNRRKCILGILLIAALFFIALVANTFFTSSESFLSLKDNDDNLVFQYLIANARTPAFVRGKNILITFENYEDSPVELPNDCPWQIETNTSSGWIVVYTPPHNDKKIIVYPREYRGTTKTTQVYWTWNFTFSNGSLLPEGYYRVVLPTNRCVYYQEFIISDTLGKIGWNIIDDILNSSVSMNKTFDVEIYLQVKNITSNLIEYLRTKIGEFPEPDVINSSDVSPNYNYSLLFTKLQKYQILKAVKLDIVYLIVNPSTYEPQIITPKAGVEY